MPLHVDGCSFYRITQPYTSLFKQDLADVVFVQHAEMEKSGFYDLMTEADYVITRIDHRDFVLEWLDKYFPNKKVILDIDDSLFDINPYTEMYAYHGLQEVKHGDTWLWKDGEADFDIERNRKRLEVTLNFIRRADIVTVSTPRLAERFKEYNQNIYVHYNSIDFNNWKPYEIKKDELRIGWTGGGSHYEDWYPVKDAITEVINNNDAKLVLAGVKFDGILKDIPEEKREFWDWVSPDGHPFRTILMNLDIAVIPLANNKFNQYKSCIKFYEFAAAGIPVMAANLAPYSDELPKEALYDNFKDQLNYLIANPKKRQEQANIALKWVRENRDLIKVSQDLLKYIECSTTPKTDN